MACIIKLPSEQIKGVVTFTTQERDLVILKDKAVQTDVEELKKNWVVGLHHNWHDFNFHYNPIFDFSMAGAEDLRSVSGDVVPLIDMDACNFVPDYFRPSSTEKFWDILYIARAVQFKRIPEFFKFVKQAYALGKKYRVLFICPVPPYDPKQTKTVFYNIREEYDKIFNGDEQNLFNLLTINYRYPFPFDLPTLAHFYRSSKLFVHFADDERRCRVAAYAWSSGLPVVGMSCVGTLLPPGLRQRPYYYECKEYEDFYVQIERALLDLSIGSHSRDYVRAEVNESFTRKTLMDKLKEYYRSHGLRYEDSVCYLDKLDIRLGRHHGIGSGPNTVPMAVGEFISLLKDPQQLAELIGGAQDPEMRVVGGSSTGFFKRFFRR